MQAHRENSHSDLPAFIRSAGLNQTSARFLGDLVSENQRLSELLTVSTGASPTSQQLEEIRTDLSRLIGKARVAKVLNAILFLVIVVVLFIGALWPLLNHFAFRSSNPTVNGMVQGAVIYGVGGALVFCYRRFKRWQSNIETNVRETLFVAEPVSCKLARLKERRQASVARPYHDTFRTLLHTEAGHEELTRCVRVATGSEPPEAVIRCLATQLLDAWIKRYSYRNLVLLFTSIALAIAVLGVFLPFYIAKLGIDQPGTQATLQSVMIFGAPAVFWGIRTQYKKRQDQIDEALRLTLVQPEPLAVKTARIPEFLRLIDSGFER